MPDDGFIPLNADKAFHWLSEGLNADERDLVELYASERTITVRRYARTSRGGYVSTGSESIPLPVRATRLA